MRDKRITIKDVAVWAGVSVGTVSRYIRNDGYVGTESKKKIASAIHELHFFPSASARGMINRDSGIIGIAVPEINNPFLADLVVKIESGLSRKNYSIMLCNTGYSTQKTEHFINDLIMRHADGIIMIATHISDKNVLEKINMFMRGVIVGQKLPRFDSIIFDDRKSAYDIAEHIIGFGHRRIACIGFHINAPQTVERRDGVIGALRDNCVPVCPGYMMGYDGSASPKFEDDSRNAGYLYTRILLGLRNPPSAIIAINDFYAVGAYEAISEKGLKVGEDIAVAGFDDISIAKFMMPPLTTVRCDTQAMASLTVEILMKKISGDSSEKTGRQEINLTLPSDIILRESTKFAARP
jgi:LacI family transcriptional regulator